MQAIIEKKFSDFRNNMCKESLGARAYLHDRLSVALPVLFEKLQVYLVKETKQLFLNKSRVHPVFHAAVPIIYFDGNFHPDKDPPIFITEEQYEKGKKKNFF
jgi:hypothetical protein